MGESEKTWRQGPNQRKGGKDGDRGVVPTDSGQRVRVTGRLSDRDAQRDRDRHEQRDKWTQTETEK